MPREGDDIKPFQCQSRNKSKGHFLFSSDSRIFESGLSSVGMIVTFYLRKCAGRKSVCFPSQQTIGDACFMNDSGVTSASRRRNLAGIGVRESAKHGVITIEHTTRKKKGGKGVSRYVFNPPEYWGTPISDDSQPVIDDDSQPVIDDDSQPVIAMTHSRSSLHSLDESIKTLFERDPPNPPLRTAKCNSATMRKIRDQVALLNAMSGAGAKGLTREAIRELASRFWRRYGKNAERLLEMTIETIENSGSMAHVSNAGGLISYLEALALEPPEGPPAVRRGADSRPQAPAP